MTADVKEISVLTNVPRCAHDNSYTEKFFLLVNTYCVYFGVLGKEQGNYESIRWVFNFVAPSQR